MKLIQRHKLESSYTQYQNDEIKAVIFDLDGTLVVELAIKEYGIANFMLINR